MVHEPMTDLFHLMSKFVTPQGKILVPGVNELVAPLEEGERYAIMTHSESIIRLSWREMGSSFLFYPKS